MEDVLIKIGASSKQFTEEMEKIESKTEQLSGHLQTMTLAAGAAFTGFAATIAACTIKFNEQEQEDLRLNAVLQSTGGIAGMTAQSITALAVALEKTTGFSEDNIKAAETVILKYTNVGSNVFPAATKAVLDFAAGTKTDATSAADALGKALNEPVQGMMRLQRQGVSFTQVQQAQIKAMDAAGDSLGAQKIILEAVTTAYGGNAEAAAHGSGQIKKMKEQVEELTEDIGQYLAPTLNAAAGSIAGFIKWVREHEEVAKLAAAALAAGVVVTGLATAAGLAALAGLKLQAALLAAKVSIDLTTFSVRALVGATGIGLIIIAATEIALHWGTIWPKMQEVFFGFISVMKNGASGLAGILRGAFTMDLGAIRKGWDEVVKAYVEGGKKAIAASSETKTGLAKVEDSAAADRMAKTRAAIQAEKALQDEKDRFNHASIVANNQATLLEYQHASTKVIELKTEEGKLLKQISDATGQKELAAVRAAAQRRLTLVRQLQTQEENEEMAREKRFQALETKNKAAFNNLTLLNQRKFDAQKRRQLIDGLNSEEDARAQAYEKMLSDHVAANNKFLADQVEFGTAYASINQVMHSDIYTGTEKATGELAQLTQSSNGTLKAAGKVAATAQIAMKTSESAMNIFSGWSAIPFIGYALGIAGAGLAVAFGAEQIGKVWAANKGGVMMGGVPGRDSIPTLTMPGELITPTQNYEEVIGSVAAQRASQNLGFGKTAGAKQQVEVKATISMKGSASQLITAQMNEDKALGRHRGNW